MNQLNYGSLIKSARNSKGIKAKWVAKKLGVSISTYTEIEADRRTLTLKRAEDIAGVLGMTLPELLRHQLSESPIKSTIPNNQQSIVRELGG